MKKVLTLLVVIISCSLSAQVPNYIPTNGLLGWWPFEGNANDASGNGNHGTVTGATLTTDRTGQAASAYLFNQNNSTHRIEAPIVATPGGLASNFTTVMWVKPTRSVNTVNNSTACPGSVSVPMANSNQNWAIYAPNFGTDIGIGLSVGTNGAFIGNHANNLLVCRGRKSFSNTGFLFVAIVHSGNTVKLYVDGILEDSIYNYCPTRLKKLSSTVILGDDLYSPGFSGIIDDFGVWNRALSTSEIVGVYQQNGCITPPSAPSANSPQYFCGSGTVGDILFNALTGSSTATYSIYANSTGGTPIPSTTSLIDGTTYYASQTINGCESSSRTPISVELQTSAITASADSICKGDTVNLSVVPSSGSSFSIGSTGPAGGIVFYDKGSITNGWRYLEVASADYGTPLPWGCAGTNVPGTSTSIGSGQSNTAAILQYCSTVNIAARACDTAIINGYSDWYLPSRGDFILINQNLSPLGLGNFINPNSNQWNRYWTSSQIGPYAWAQDFTPVYTQITLKNDPWNVRPVRQFASGIPFSTYVWSTGDTTSSISVVPDSTTQYWVDITLNGNTCRYYHTVNTSAPVAPSGSAVQTLLCAPTVAQLSATGTSVQWYNVASGGTPLNTTDTLVDNTVYYASQTINGCESIDRLAVTAIVPTVSITATADSICKGDTVSLSANLNVNAPSCNNLPGSLSNGLLGWYPFCGNANDESGNGNHGILSGPLLDFNRSGSPNSSYSFNGGGNKITINPPVVSTVTNEMGVSLWMKIDSLSPAGAIFKKGGNTGNFDQNQLYWNSGQKKLRIYNSSSHYTTYNITNPNLWNHLCWNLVDSVTELFINGVSQGVNNIGFPFNSTSGLVALGGSANWGYIIGNIDDIGIWNRALTLSEIQSLYSITDPTYQWSTGDTTSSISVVPDSTTQYWVDITLNGNTCRYYHTVNTSAPVAPSGSAVQTLLCAPTVAQLSATGTSIQWYNVASGGTPLNTTDTLVDNTVYYASQTINGCESIDRLAVTAIVPTVSITASADSICKGDTVSLSASNVSINGLYGSVPYLNTAGNATFLPLDTAQWYYIAITKDNNNQAKIYKNGQLVFSGNFLPRSYSWSRLDLGAVYYTSYSNWFEGLIDEVRISNTVRSSSSISNYFASNTPLTSDNNTIGLWHFDQASGSTISASTGTSGTVHNATWSSNGKFGNCLSYNGVNARARISQSIPTSNMTFEFWIKPKTYQGSWPVSWYGSYTAGFGINVNTTIPTYQWSTGDTTSSISVVPDSTTQYWVDITLNGNTCRYYKTITSFSTASPSGNTIQTFCNSATVGDLLATGSSVAWYNTASGGLPLANGLSLTDSTMYYASQVINGCPSETRLPVLVIIQSPGAPIGPNAQNFCYSATLSQIVVTGSNIKYYNSAVGGVALNSTSPLVSGSTYYLSQTINNCESSTRLPVSIIISNPTTPSGPFVQSFCDSASVSQLIAIGQGIVWYSAPTGGSPLVSSQNLINGATYYAAQTINGCESSVRMSVYVSIQVTTPPIIPASTQVFCNFAQVGQLSAVGTNLTWYSSFTGSNPLSLSDTLVNGTTYFVSQTINGCESQRSSVIAIVNTTPTPSGSSIQSFCDSAFVGDLLAVGSQINWYLTPTGGTALPNSTPLNSNTYYYASQTLNNCESNGRLQCLVLITPSPSYTLSINGGLNFCTNDSISTTFNLTGISPQNTSVLWRQNGLPYSTQNSINPASPGYYDAVLTSLLGCTTIVPGDSIRVFSPPVVLIVGDTILNVGDTSTYSVTLANANTAYTWTIYGGTILSGQGTNSIQVVWSGNGYVSLLGTNQGCTDVDSLFVSVSGIGLSFVQTRNIYLYPNPTYGTFIIGGMDNPYSATIYSMTGKAVRSYPIAPSVFDLNGLSAGEYQIVLTDETGFIEIMTLILQR